MKILDCCHRLVDIGFSELWVVVVMWGRPGAAVVGSKVSDMAELM